MLKIKEFLENNLGFDSYSLNKLINSQAIAIGDIKAINNAKPKVSLTIKNVRILTNYFAFPGGYGIPVPGKGRDFMDFKIICRAIYNGCHRREEIKSLIFKLALTMNNFRLSTNPKPV